VRKKDGGSGLNRTVTEEPSVCVCVREEEREKERERVSGFKR